MIGRASGECGGQETGNGGTGGASLFGFLLREVLWWRCCKSLKVGKLGDGKRASQRFAWEMEGSIWQFWEGGSWPNRGNIEQEATEGTEWGDKWSRFPFWVFVEGNLGAALLQVFEAWGVGKWEARFPALAKGSMEARVVFGRS